jgi:flagellar basal-body rod protein FlgF
VRTPNGISYTRSGQFQIDLNGEIVSPDGNQLLDETFQTVTIPNDGGPVSVANDGTISNEAGILARLRPMVFNNEQELARIGNSLLQTDQVPTANPDATIKQGFLEGSNVQSVLEMTRLMDTVRAFQGTQRLIETQHELTRRTVERVLSNG